jgi:hypothetical protein
VSTILLWIAIIHLFSVGVFLLLATRAPIIEDECECYPEEELSQCVRCSMRQEDSTQLSLRDNSEELPHKDAA